MATLDKVRIPVAASNHSKLDVSSTHITSSSFLQLQPVYYRHMLPGEHIKGVGSVLSRLAPVQVPTYGKCRINLRSYFVPFRCVFPNFHEFLTDTIGSNNSASSLVNTSPSINNDSIVSMFTTSTYNLATAVGATDPYDFIVNSVRYEFTRDGMIYNKILESLGYKIIWTTDKSFTWSALPLLCYFKVYYDYYANSQYMDSAGYLTLAQLFKYNTPNGNLSISVGQLYSCLQFTEFVCYDGGKQVFLNAWDNPVAPNTGNFSSLTMQDIVGGNSVNVGTLSTNGSPIMSQSSASTTSIGSEYIHQVLTSMTSFVKRNQLSGARAVDRFLSRFGILLDSSKIDRSIYVSSQSIDIDFGSVMSNAETTGASLGEYAGQGFGRGQLEFDFKADEFGMFFVLSSIVPDGSLYQGFDRNNLHLLKQDFWQPEFDNLGCQSIMKGEVFVADNDAFASASTDYKGNFGWAPRYYEYKQNLNRVTGAMNTSTMMQGGDAWHLFRKLSEGDFASSINGVQHGLAFTRGIDFYNYDRIFQYTFGDVDNFYLVYHFAAESLAPCKSLFDSFDFDEFGKKLTLDSSGPKVN